MNIPEYVTEKEVKRVCKELGLSDWTEINGSNVAAEEAGIILKALAVKDMNVDKEDFRKGLEVELEHGTMFPDMNVTNNHPLLTGMIVLAHFKETLDYYQRLDVAEIEGDIYNAFRDENQERVYAKVGKLIDARAELSMREQKG